MDSSRSLRTKDAGDLAAAVVYLLEAGMTTGQVAGMWSPYLTMAEGIRIACKAFHQSHLQTLLLRA